MTPPATPLNVPAVKMRAAVSPTMRPMARMMPEKMPGTADGSTMRNTVRSLPAPRPKLPSRNESGTAFSASSVVRRMVGRTMMASVSAPASMDLSMFRAMTNIR